MTDRSHTATLDSSERLPYPVLEAACHVPSPKPLADVLPRVVACAHSLPLSIIHLPLFQNREPH